MDKVTGTQPSVPRLDLKSSSCSGETDAVSLFLCTGPFAQHMLTGFELVKMINHQGRVESVCWLTLIKTAQASSDKGPPMFHWIKRDNDATEPLPKQFCKRAGLFLIAYNDNQRWQIKWRDFLTVQWNIKIRISYKILLLAYKALNGLAPAYLTYLLSRYNPTRSLVTKLWTHDSTHGNTEHDGVSFLNESTV